MAFVKELKNTLTRNRVLHVASQREAMSHPREDLDMVRRLDLNHNVFSPAAELQRERMVDLCKSIASSFAQTAGKHSYLRMKEVVALYSEGEYASGIHSVSTYFSCPGSDDLSGLRDARTRLVISQSGH